MELNQFFTEPQFIKNLRGPKNIDAFVKQELKTDFPLNFDPSKKPKTKDGFYYQGVLSRTIKGVTTSLFQLFHAGVPIYDHGINLTYEAASYGILSCSSKNYDTGISKKMEGYKAIKTDIQINPDVIAKALDIERNILRLKALKVDLSEFKYEISITSVKEIICQYQEKERQGPHKKARSNQKLENIGIFQELPYLRIPEVDKSVKDGDYCQSKEVLFSTTMPWGILHWRMIIDVASLSVLHVRVLTDNLGGFTYDDAPSAMTGDITILPTSPLAVLNDIRNPRAIPRLTSNIPPYVLSGEFVELAELSLPANVNPTTAANFDYDVDTQEFAAVNAYVHNDYLFRLVSDMGFNMAVYFDGTTFPVPVDHNGFFGCVNACAPGNATADGSGGFHYGLMQAGTTVGISLSKRIALHEFGHALLWDNVHSPNLGFCHSVGDSLAAVLMDPRSIEPDRFVTFPWLTLANPGIDRRHDRTVAAGWGWYGANDDGAYGSEQILSSTHFRIYQALGGDSENRCDREWAARYTAYLIFFAIGSLTPITNSNTPEHWANMLIQSDLATGDFECHKGKLVHKVIRWAFEKQNAFDGLPPAADVYIDDGRHGKYHYAEDICSTKDIWNRHLPDNGNDQQVPIIGKTNYAYVIVRNRGLDDCGTIVVKGFRTVSHCCGKPKEDLCFPTDFISLQTEKLRHNNIPADSYAVIGPFKWIPCSKNDSLLFAVSCKTDPSNIEIMSKGFAVNAGKLARFDNNIAFRQTCDHCKCC